ncbi:MAG: hypothetical protein FJ318_01495 [SAR202 cluster bacterium]|nr:hypothetical protein [SAR202 cluster bacterium]
MAAATPGEPELPPGFEARGIPDVELNAYVYGGSAQGVRLATSAFGDSDLAGQTHSVPHVLEVAARAARSEWGVYADLRDARAASALAARIEAGDRARQLSWVTASGSALHLGASTDPVWASDLQRAWSSDTRASIASRYPELWHTVRLLPEDAPGEAIAAGFIRNASSGVDTLLAGRGVEAAGLDGALASIKLENHAFAVYASDIARVPGEPTARSLPRSRAWHHRGGQRGRGRPDARLDAGQLRRQGWPGGGRRGRSKGVSPAH